MLPIALWCLSLAHAQSTVPEADVRAALDAVYERAGEPILLAAVGFEAHPLVRELAKAAPDRFETARVSELEPLEKVVSEALGSHRMRCAVAIAREGDGWRLTEHGTCDASAAAPADTPSDAPSDAPSEAPADRSGTGSVTFTKLILRDDETGIVRGAATEEYRILVLETLREAGFDVRGAESLLFGKDASAEARYLLGGTVREGV